MEALILIVVFKQVTYFASRVALLKKAIYAIVTEPARLLLCKRFR
jgi:hypothetical protein